MKMRKIINVVIIALGFAGILSIPVFAGETGHYVSGLEGIRAGTLPPPGYYYKIYNLLYKSDTLVDRGGNKIDAGFDLTVFASAHRFIWVTNKKILGADYVIDATIPLVYTDVKIDSAGIDNSIFALADLCIEPIALGWHGACYDAAFAADIYIPTGKYDKNKPASPGKDFWTGMLTLGGTYYLDDKKTWSVSVLSRYEIHSRKDKTDVKPGDDFHFEWGIGKTLAEVWDIGLAGYCHWQITDDSGSDVNWDKGVHDRVHAVGPEISVFSPCLKLLFSIRSLFEFKAVDRSEGNITTLTLTKIF